MANCEDRNGNCTKPSDDELPAQCVGPWASDKHVYIGRFIDASHGARAKYLGRGGAGFIDLFAGPGRARIRDSGEFVDGSPLIALKQARAPFSRVVLCDLAKENTAALAERTKADARRTVIIPGDCNKRIDDIIREVPEYGLNLALVDPYGLRPLSFDTIAKLASLKRMDLIINFPTSDMKRNFGRAHWKTMIDRFLGTTTWQSAVKKPADVVKLIDVLRGQLGKVGYTGDAVRSIPITNTKHGVLYHLMFASKHTLGDGIWRSITKNAPGGQTGFGFT